MTLRISTRAQAAVIGCVLGWAHAAAATDICNTTPPRHFKINTQSFVTAYAQYIPGLTEEQVEWWVLYAAKQWAVQSGAGILLAYDGRTTALPHCANATYTYDGVTEIAAYPLGGTIGWSNNEDICTDSAHVFFVTNYPVTNASPPQYDFVQVLMHEFGHWLGLGAGTCLPGQPCDSQGHALTGDTVMRSDMICGTTIARSLTGNDILRMRNAWAGVKNANCSRAGGGWRQTLGQNVLSAFGGTTPSSTLSYQVFSTPGAALVPNGSNQVFISSHIIYANDGPLTPTGIGFTRLSNSATDAALTSATEQTFIGDTYKTHAAPAVAGKQGLTVAAWPAYQDFYYKCGGMNIARSTNQFTNVSVVNLSADCTLRQPALAYDPSSNRFILAYVWQSSLKQGDSFEPGDPFQDTLVVRTSADGTTWSDPIGMFVFNVPVKSADGPGLACSSTGVCMLTGLVSWGQDARPVPIDLQLAIAANGTITIQNAGFGATVRGYHVDPSVSAGDYFWLSQWTDVTSDPLNRGITYDRITASIPLTTQDFGLGQLVSTVRGYFPSKIAGTPTSSWTYTVTVVP